MSQVTVFLVIAIYLMSGVFYSHNFDDVILSPHLNTDTPYESIMI